MTDNDPMTGTLRLSVEDVDNACVVIAKGEIDLATADQLVTAVEMLSDGGGPIILDLTEVEFIDSSGVRALLRCEQAAAEAGRAFALLRPSGPVARILDLVDLRSRFIEVDGLDAAHLAAIPEPSGGV